MGNCFATICTNGSSLSVVKLDGKLLQFRAPILVKDVLSNLSGAGAGAGVSRKAKKLLGPDHELRLGRIYYIVPYSSSSFGRTDYRAERVSCTEPSSSSCTSNREVCSKKVEKDGSCGVKRRIKVVITKQQLQDLLSEKISVEDVISGTGKGVDSPESWSPRLESIPEGRE